MSSDTDLDISAPTRSSALDISPSVVLELFLRRTLIDDTVTVTHLTQALGLSHPILFEAFETLRDRKMIDVKTMQGHDYLFCLTSIGRDYARELTAACQYNGIAPVSLDTYVKAVRLQKASLKVNRSAMAKAMSDLVVSTDMLDQLGPAFNSQHSIFFYGPAGTGKTSLAERLVRLYGDWIVIPRAVMVDGQYVLIYDPTLHEPIEEQPAGLDPRWVACNRPLVTVGGELEASALQLQYDTVGRIYSAPLHVKANNGMMLIDDFGRQVLTPQQLLNRWIYPLVKRVDFLTLANGTKFGMPFELMVAFSTNMDPDDLGDEAFFRRIQNKVYVGPVDAVSFDRILVDAALRLSVRLLPTSAPLLRALCLRRDHVGLRANYPNDLCKMIRSVAEYEECEPIFDQEMLRKAADLYWGNLPISEASDDEGPEPQVALPQLAQPAVLVNPVVARLALEDRIEAARV